LKRNELRRLAAVLLVSSLAALTASAQTRPEAPREPEVLYNGFQLSLYGGGTLMYMNGEYYGSCPCDFFGDITSSNLIFGASMNIPVFQDASIYLRAGLNRTSTTWTNARTDSLFSTPGTGYIVSDLVFDYDLHHLDFLIRLIGNIDGERVYIGPSFGFVRKKHVRITDSELSTGAARIVEDAAMVTDHELRVSMIIGAEYAFVPIRNLYVIPAIEVDYAFGRITQNRLERPNFRLRPTFYKLLVTLAYQIF